MKKIIIVLFVSMILLTGLTVAVMKPYILDKFNANKLSVLEKKGIGKFEVYNDTCILYNETTDECEQTDGGFIGYKQPMVSDCEYYDENTCVFSVQEKNGISRSNIKISTKVCSEYNETTSECINWIDKSQEDIDEEIEYWIEHDLEQIIAVTERRLE